MDITVFYFIRRSLGNRGFAANKQQQNIAIVVVFMMTTNSPWFASVVMV